MAEDRRASNTPELLAPAGSPACLPAAVAGGADAVYLGLHGLNARARAPGLRAREFGGYVRWLHGHRRAVYLTLNIVLLDREYPAALDQAALACDAGIDGVIVADLGLLRLLRRRFPVLRLHASTQTGVAFPEQIAILADLGLRRAVLARELRLAEIAACVEAGRRHGVEVECFVHGALCYAWSGQCHCSALAGPRSGLRGTCSQPCRLDYYGKRLFGMKDLSLLGRVGALAEIGVTALKIEGRLKDPDYVWAVSRLYRDALDAWAAGRPFDLGAATEVQRAVFARRFTDGPFHGRYDDSTREADPTPAEADAVLVVGDRAGGSALIESQSPITAGQGFAFGLDGGRDGFLVIGSRQERGGAWRCRIRVAAEGPPLPAGARLTRNHDQDTRVAATKAMAAFPLPRRPEAIPVSWTLTAALGQPLVLTAHASDGRSMTVTGIHPAQAATGRPLDQAQVQAAIGTLADSIFATTAVALACSGPVFAPLAEVKDLRRQVLAGLAAAPVPKRTVAIEKPDSVMPTPRRTGLWVAVSGATAAAAVRNAGAERVWLDGALGDCWALEAPCLPSLPEGCWFRHPPTLPTTPHLATIGLPVVAGQLGTLRAARAAGLPATADSCCNALSWQSIIALAEAGAEAVLLGIEGSARDLARILRHPWDCDGISLPALAIAVHGRLPAMIGRHDHGLPIGQQRRLAGPGARPLVIERRTDGTTVVWEGRRLCAPEIALLARGRVDAWVLELADLDPPAAARVTQVYRQLLDGRIEPDAVRERCLPFCPDGFLPEAPIQRGAGQFAM